MANDPTPTGCYRLPDGTLCALSDAQLEALHAGRRVAVRDAREVVRDHLVTDARLKQGYVDDLLDAYAAAIRAECHADTKRLDWLDAHGGFSIQHQDRGKTNGMSYARWGRGPVPPLREALDEAMADAAIRAGRAGEDALYHELLYEVAQKFPGETRHETARRYIREREAQQHTGADAAMSSDAGGENAENE